MHNWVNRYASFLSFSSIAASCENVFQFDRSSANSTHRTTQLRSDSNRSSSARRCLIVLISKSPGVDLCPHTVCNESFSPSPSDLFFISRCVSVSVYSAWIVMSSHQSLAGLHTDETLPALFLLLLLLVSSRVETTRSNLSFTSRRTTRRPEASAINNIELSSTSRQQIFVRVHSVGTPAGIDDDDDDNVCHSKLLDRKMTSSLAAVTDNYLFLSVVFVTDVIWFFLFFRSLSDISFAE